MVLSLVLGYFLVPAMMDEITEYLETRKVIFLLFLSDSRCFSFGNESKLITWFETRLCLKK